ncbi:DUF805 domain-containing protein (plasmid) [Rhizobium leguminosarum]|uniref:DUF805 domain-containing protein n=2 Tax=Rhizobium TaxID=379 RepID=A0ABZ1DXP3_9HYPH|nr:MULTISPECIES: DUF805 domain-containing protein [Rhizobium]MBY5493936.1 DUF805 domain-containing protein [Rhizobium leguminosarum]NKJ92524.1 DUF805 domain-containing protein [Rhizobium leguminosarum bv. viciae]NKK42425.1 DUF805 domain-containing protein [Rhizobium leguminosarum bv. viciae]NNU53163.1 DUF805 domain-containing protein [Rhizobium indigoferae]TAY43983.1 DUF805 domain-containing protein [Rhizobium leguminosarum]
MGFSEAAGTALVQKYATFSGRASRSEYWWFVLFYFTVLFAIGIVCLVTSSFSDFRGGVPSPVALLLFIGGLTWLAMFLPQVALQVRRFHDRNISGWWYLALFVGGFVPYIGVIAGIAILVISVLPGTDGPNKFGPDPLRPEARAEVFA